jgi:hypothetical protein
MIRSIDPPFLQDSTDAVSAISAPSHDVGHWRSAAGCMRRQAVDDASRQNRQRKNIQKLAVYLQETAQSLSHDSPRMTSNG